jgi:hypothetical protein
MSKTYSIFRGDQFLGTTSVPDDAQPTIAEGCTCIEGDHTPPPPPIDEAARVRSLRAHLLDDCAWIVQKAYSRGEPVAPEWAAYMQALRDVPQQDGFPLDVHWPTPPG